MTTTTEKLYDLANAREILSTWLEETDGELTPELEQLLSELDGKVDEKIERVALFIREQLTMAKGIKEEEERLAARRKARERAADSLKQYLHVQMDRIGKGCVDGLLCTVALQNSPPSVKGELTPQALANFHAAGLPFVKHIPASYVLDRRAVIEYHKTTNILPDGLTIEQAQHVRIR